jgi:hypothetical protein
MNLRNWLKKTPRPAAVMADDKRIEVPNNYRAINDLVATVQALEPSKLTCLDKDGKVIRSITLDNESDDERAPVAGSPEMSDLQLFARLLADGYEHGRKANQPIIDSAMQFVERQSVRLAKAEAEIERLRTHNHKLNMQILELSIVPAEEPAAPMDNGFMGALLEGAMQGVAQQQIKQVTPLKPPQNTGVKK